MSLSRAEIELLLETGDKPTQVNFASIFTAVPNINDDGILSGGDQGITAFAGGGQANATQLTKKNNEVTIAVNLNDSVKLPTGIAGMLGSIINSSANIITLYPTIGGKINNLGINNPIPLAVGQTAIFSCYSANSWLAVG